MDDAAPIWPDLPYPLWRDTAATLQLWTQIVGKVRLTLTPWLNHGWQVPLYVTARGLGTSPIPVGNEILEIEFDFISHRLVARTSRGEERAHPLAPQTVADFYRAVIDLLSGMGIAVAINEMPNEVPNPIRFSQDRTHAAYDAVAAHRFWRALVQIDRIFKLFRSGFLGKASPVHFFWGSFDLAVTRFSGRPAPLHPGGVPGLPDAVTREAYSHEVSSAGFWPGSEGFPARCRCTPTPIPNRPASATGRSRRAPTSTRRLGSSSCHTKRSVLPRNPTPCCSTSCLPPMRPQPRPEAGTARRWSVRWVFRRRYVGSSVLFDKLRWRHVADDPAAASRVCAGSNAAVAAGVIACIVAYMTA